ncbi:response regulator transcription factor [Planomicrobium sp. CPCC 101079]|uniref:response regulator transcription factor n=1 Tax=Planomicrobium sp. CPCC 101079 TaxID=2599618 RepID=UPI0011B4109D|nr:response regulator transcription factor [Planomicrobium sp. CPCC 101079]TWT04822.1 response regulator transcription factor [Planomicrobium sp. CPCC 101079]
MAERILIVEDEKSIARVLELELTYEGYETAVAYTGAEGLIKFRENDWNLILLDLMLPEIHGLDVLKRIRSSNLDTPVILLTAKSDVKDKVAGLDLGANDYVTKPFEIEELLARIRACLRLNNGTNNKDVHRFEELELNESTRDVSRNGRVIELTPREFDLLLYLMQHPQQVLSREQVLNAVWGYDYYGDTNVIDVYIRYLRKKIDAGETSTYIQTVRGIGYVLKEHPNEAEK